MRVLLATMGSDGDVQPFLGLAQRLIRGGHDVRLATSDRYAARAQRLGVPFVAVGPPWDDLAVKALFARMLAERNPMRQLAIVIEGMAPDQRAAVPDLIPLARDVDVVVYAPLFVGAAVAARAAGARHVSVHLAPLHRASAYGPTGGSFGRLGNRLLWALAAAMLRRETDSRLNQVVAAAGLTPWRDILLDASHSRMLDLLAVSPSVLDPDPLWGPETRVTGYLFADEPEWTPDEALEAFVSQEPPVVIGFGSMVSGDPQDATQLIAGAVEGLGRRVVLQAGWAGLGAAALPKNVHVAGFVPHAWLFDRAACVVHHGGAGTTAAALRAGVPQAIVWHVGDQPVWGRRVFDLGVGPRPRASHALDARWLRAALERMLTDRTMMTRAKALGATIRREDGATAAMRAIEAALGGASQRREATSP